MYHVFLKNLFLTLRFLFTLSPTKVNTHTEEFKENLVFTLLNCLVCLKKLGQMTNVLLCNLVFSFNNMIEKPPVPGPGFLQSPAQGRCLRRVDVQGAVLPIVLPVSFQQPPPFRGLSQCVDNVPLPNHTSLLSWSMQALGQSSLFRYLPRQSHWHSPMPILGLEIHAQRCSFHYCL